MCKSDKNGVSNLCYKPEMEFFTRVLEKMHLNVRVVFPDVQWDLEDDMGLRHFLGLRQDGARLFPGGLETAKAGTIYRLVDVLSCNYLFWLLPQTDEARGILVGPYTTVEVTRETILELAEQFGIPAVRLPLLESGFANIPLLRDPTFLLTMVSALAERMWGKDRFQIVDLEQELPAAAPVQNAQAEDPQEILYRMKLMETRYAYENELMQMVAQGQRHRAELMIASFSTLVFEQRVADPISNMKNYAVICNTLLRKAAERGGVHPVYLDRTSADFARKIGALADMGRGQALMAEMVNAYCRLVRKHASSHYSAPVQRTVAYIEADLVGDLSLRALARVQNLSPGYLSTLFRQETGKTLTQYVTEQRMENGARLLRTTRLQIQTIAQHCGISDTNYFTKLFKKQMGVTPNEYRQRAKK